MADIAITTDLTQLRALDQQIARTNTGVNSMGGAAQHTSRKMNAMGVGMQQAGYQVGDFLVQVQSGTNWMVAFGQQATQLVGILPMFNSVMGISGTALVGLSAGLGIAIPLATALGAAFMRTATSGRTITDTLEALGDSIDAVSDNLERLQESYDDSADAASRFTESIRENLQALVESDLRQAEREIANLGQQLSEMFSVTEGVQTGRIADFFDVNIFLAFTDAQRQSREEARLLTSEFIGLQNTLNEGGLTLQEQADTLQRMRELAQALAEQNGDITDQEDELIRQLAEAANEAFRLLDATEQVSQAGMQVNSFLQASNNLLPPMSAIMSEIAEESEAAAEKSERFQQALEVAAGGTFNTLTEQVASVAAATGLAADEALRWLQTLNLALDTAPEVRGPDQAIADTRSTFNLNPLSVRTYRGSSGDASGGGGAGGQSLSEIISQMEQEANQRLELIQLSERQSRVREIELELIREIGGEADATAMAQIQAAAQTIAAIENQVEVLENLRDVQEGFADTVSESFGDALMSIIDGTKSTEDAFKSMAAAIIRELYDILVVQQLVGSIRDSVSESGFLSNLLSSMAGRASGGTMNPNQPYLVGERGPEIVMPGRQSTVTNANQTRQAMSQESAPVINMTYNFQGGITEADLARATPMLVERTKAAVVDTVQRGGSMARVFR
jgi:ABC-type transporter Mla subunit MlaD